MQMKFKAHQSFAVRKGWLGKGLRTIANPNNAALLMPSNSKAAMDELGLGSNQVVALRYWMQTLGLVDYRKGSRNREHVLTPLGKLIYENDPYTEEIGTLWALHCNLASASEDAASWHFFFNEFGMSVFTRKDFTRALERYIFTYNDKKDVSLKSLEDDFNCIINTYVAHGYAGKKGSSPESVIDCPLGELGLVGIESRRARSFRKTSANPAMLPALLVLYCICTMMDFQKRMDSPLGREIRLADLLDAPCSPGRVFNLDAVALLGKLYELEGEGYVRINRTAGLDVVRLNEPGMTATACLERYYKIIG